MPATDPAPTQAERQRRIASAGAAASNAIRAARHEGAPCPVCLVRPKAPWATKRSRYCSRPNLTTTGRSARRCSNRALAAHVAGFSMDHQGYISLLRQRREQLHARIRARKAREAERQQREAEAAARRQQRALEAAAREARRAGARQTETAPCAICGTGFTRRAGAPNAPKTCSPECRRIRYRLRQRASRVRSKQDERQMPASPPAERVDLEILWARAHGRCQQELPSGHLCGRTCHIGHPDLRAPDRATRGYRVPLSQGGLCDLANAFLRCTACAASPPRPAAAPAATR